MLFRVRRQVVEESIEEGCFTTGNILDFFLTDNPKTFQVMKNEFASFVRKNSKKYVR